MPKGKPGTGVDGSSRRDFLKKTAVAGGVIWAAPAITSASRAFAQAGSPPGQLCPSAGCFGTGYGLGQDVINPAVYPATPGAPCPGNCLVNVAINQGQPPSSTFPISATSGTFCGCHVFTPGVGDSGVCRSEGSIQNLHLGVWRGFFSPVTPLTPIVSDMEIEAEVLSSHTQQVCPTCGVTRGSDVVNLRIRDPRTGTFFGVGNSQSPNRCVVNSAVFPGFKITLNEQGCQNGLWYTAALHVHLPNATPSQFGRDIFLGFSSARQDACGACVPSPPSTEPCVIPLL
jgi:hypothetical protein